MGRNGLELDIKKTAKTYNAKSDYMRAKEKYNLTYRQYLFCRSYIVSSNGTKSAQEAGYKGNLRQLAVTANQNLKKANIVQYIDDEKSRKEHNSDVLRDEKSKFGMAEVIDLYIDLAQHCDNPSVRRAALSDLTKIFGGFAPQQIDVNQNVNISMQLQAARQRQMEYLASVDGSTVEALPEEVKEVN